MYTLKLAFRTLARTPFLTGIAVLSLGLGIGANAAIFSVFDLILLRPLPVQAPEQLINLQAPGLKPGSTSCNQAGDCDVIFSYPMFRDLQQAETGLAGLAAHRLFGANLASAEATTNGQGLYVSGSYFPMLGATAALGRLIGPSDDERAGEHDVVVLSYRYWERERGLDPAVLNSALVVNGRPMTVVGVTAEGFYGTTLGADPDIFAPISMREALTPGWTGLDNRRSYWVYVIGRLGENQSMEQARLALNQVYSGIINEVEVPLQSMSDSWLERFKNKEITVEAGFRGQSSMDDEASTPLLLLLSITGLVLLIACANIANLLLARGAARSREMAIRGSLGAGRGQLLGQLMTESLLLAVLGGLASLVVARWTLFAIVRAIPPSELGAVAPTLSAPVLLFTAALSVGTGVLFGLYPALHASKQDLVSMLKSGGGQPSASRGAARFRHTLVTAQIAFSMALLVAAGLFIRSLVNVARVDLGMQTENVITFGLSPELNGYEPDRIMQFFPEVEREIAAIPGVTQVGVAMVPLLAGSNWGTDVSVEGFESGPEIDSNSRLNVIGPGYFSTLGVPLLAGREFTEGDVLGAPRVAVVNEAFTRKFNLDGGAAVGKFMTDGGSGQDDLDMQIVGVVQDASYSNVKQSVPALFFTAYRQDQTVGSVNFYVKTALDPDQILGAIPQTISRLDPNLPVEDLKTLETQVAENVYEDRLISTLAASFAVLATLLAAIGLYGVLAYSVAQRTREIGVRMALGARKEIVRRMVLRQVSKLTVLGGVIGIAGAYALSRTAESLLFGMDGTDPLVMLGGVVLIVAVAFGAAYVPARRASRVDPIHALRYE